MTHLTGPKQWNSGCANPVGRYTEQCVGSLNKADERTTSAQTMTNNVLQMCDLCKCSSIDCYIPELCNCVTALQELHVTNLTYEVCGLLPGVK